MLDSRMPLNEMGQKPHGRWHAKVNNVLPSCMRCGMRVRAQLRMHSFAGNIDKNLKNIHLFGGLLAGLFVDVQHVPRADDEAVQLAVEDCVQHGSCVVCWVVGEEISQNHSSDSGARRVLIKLHNLRVTTEGIWSVLSCGYSGMLATIDSNSE